MWSAHAQFNRSHTYGYPGADCNWTWTSLDEFGHTQGLAHAWQTNVVMYANDHGVTTLQGDDKQGHAGVYKIALGCFQ